MWPWILRYPEPHLDTLIDNSYLVPADREKMAAELQKCLNAILRLTEKIASLSTPGYEEG